MLRWNTTTLRTSKVLRCPKTACSIARPQKNAKIGNRNVTPIQENIMEKKDWGAWCSQYRKVILMRQERLGNMSHLSHDPFHEHNSFPSYYPVFPMEFRRSAWAGWFFIRRMNHLMCTYCIRIPNLRPSDSLSWRSASETRGKYRKLGRKPGPRATSPNRPKKSLGLGLLIGSSMPRTETRELWAIRDRKAKWKMEWPHEHRKLGLLNGVKPITRAFLHNNPTLHMTEWYSHLKCACNPIGWNFLIFHEIDRS
jgi:hypothetical protein